MKQTGFWLPAILLFPAALGTAAAVSPSPSKAIPLETNSWLVRVEHAPKQPRAGEPVLITAVVRPEVTTVSLQYQRVEPGAYLERKDPAYLDRWLTIPMQPEPLPQSGRSFAARMPVELQQHRNLIRYRLTGTDATGHHLRAPEPTHARPNYAYFVYNGLPPWTGAINPRSPDPKLSAPVTFSPEVLSRVQTYHLIARKSAIENAAWKLRDQSNICRYTGTLVVDGEVYDHVGFRARGGVWRYEMGKNMWKFELPGQLGWRARNDFGQPYPVPWTRINLRSCIQQGDYGCRGEQGMFESVGFRLFNLAGVAAPLTHWIQLRIIDEAREATADQYRGDYWGLYLAIENDDGRFLQTHGLPDGNLYKMEDGGGQLNHQGTNGVADGSDLNQFLAGYSRANPPEAWWRSHLNLPVYYSYRAICECIHHYDISDGKNYDYYLNPATRQWQVIPWDIDLTWANHMFGTGDEPFKRRVLNRPGFRVEYQNRLREIRDLLFNPEQTGQLIDEYAAVIGDPAGGPSVVEADRRLWDYHPAMTTGFKAGQGLFYRAASTRDFPGMVQWMKRYVQSRAAWIDSTLLADSLIPETPVVRSAGPTNFPAGQLRFRASAFKGAGAFAAIKWRLAEITPAQKPITQIPLPRRYEITPSWESDEILQATLDIAIPAGIAQAGHAYRVRARMKDATGRWSHWSAPVEFVPTPAGR